MSGGLSASPRLISEFAKTSARCTGLLATLAAFAALASPAHAITIDEAMEIAIRSHPELKAEMLEAEAADRTVGAARSGYFPSISFDGSLRDERTERPTFDRTLTAREYSVTVTQPIFDGLATPARVSEARSDAEAEAFEAGAVRNDIALEVADAFLGALEARKRLEIFSAQEARARDIFDKLQKRAEVDRGLRSIVVVGRSQVEEARFLTLEAQRDVTLADARYRELVGDVPGELVEPVPPVELVGLDDDAALARAEAAHPVLAAARARAEAAGGSKRVTRAALMPRLDAELRARKGDNIEGITGRDNDYYAGLRVTYQFATGGAAFYDLSAASYREKAALARVYDAARDVRLDVLTALETYRSQSATHAVLASRLAATSELVRVYDAQFVSGRRDLIDLYFVLSEERSAARAELEARFERLRSAYALMAALGDLGPSVTAAPSLDDDDR